MSKYVEFTDVKFASRECLLAALKALGYPAEQVEEGERLNLYGFRGDQRPETAEVVIRRQHLATASNDLGFRHTSAGYVPIVSDYDVSALARKHKCREHGFIAKLKATYAEAVVQEVARRLRGKVVAQASGSVRKLVVRY